MAFPYNSVLDSGAGTNANPIAGNWSGPSFAGAGTSQAQRLSNTITNGTSNGGSYWNVTNFGADSEVYATINTLGGVNEDVRLMLGLTTIGSGTTRGYVMLIKTTGVGTYSQRIFTVTNGALAAQVGTTQTQALSTGDSLGFTRIANTFQMYYKASGGSWVKLGGAYTNTTNTGAGKIGAEFNSTSYAITNFGGGTITKASSILGYNTIGASGSGTPSGYTANSGVSGSGYTMPAGGGTLDGMYMYVDPSGLGSDIILRLAIYNESASKPASLFSYTDEVTILHAGTASWVYFDIASGQATSLVGGNKYWIGTAFGSSPSTPNWYKFDANGTQYYGASTYTQGSPPPGTAPTGSTNSSQVSRYAIYTAAGGAATEDQLGGFLPMLGVGA